MGLNKIWQYCNINKYSLFAYSAIKLNQSINQPTNQPNIVILKLNEGMPSNAVNSPIT